MSGLFSTELIADCRKALKDNEQVILFQNRRGYSPMVRCKECGWVPKCENCDVSLTYHKHSHSLVCHYCGYTIPLPDICPACQLPGIEIVGYGTERIEDDIDAVFPGEKISRMDLDTTRSKNSYDRIIDEFSQHRTNILVGTQMVTKGLDFDAVSVVGILNADTMINFPDFRSHERAFDMLEQVSGRAGRAHKQGQVIIQTSNPDHDVIKFVHRSPRSLTSTSSTATMPPWENWPCATAACCGRCSARGCWAPWHRLWLGCRTFSSARSPSRWRPEPR